MNETLKTILSVITLGISSLVEALIKKKEEREYRYKPKSKKDSHCKYRLKCDDWQCCLETEESCKKVKNGQCPANSTGA